MVDRNDKDGMSRVPVLVILGATGSGKSRLGIELARKFFGEIISADSMQVYKGLDIVTAKVTKQERNMATHHMLDVIDPLIRNFTVADFRSMALPIIDDLLTRKKMPIIVGGTNYYIEALLWKILIDNKEAPEGESEACTSGDEASPEKKRKIDCRYSETSNEELHRRLIEVDPEMAKRLHPNNRRKVLRSLEVFEQHGVTHSELLRSQREAGGCGLGGPLRHRNSIILWLQCERKILAERLNRRVDDMLEAGLVQELLDFHERYNKQNIENDTSPDYTKGIFQTIGFKEFHTYLVLPEEERRSEKGEKLLNQGIEDLKIVTRRYANKQNRWVRNRLIRRADRQVPPVYSLDCSDVAEWDERVLRPAVEIVSAIMRGEKPQQRPLNENVEDRKTSDSSNEESHFCEVCQRIFVGSLQWNAHLNGAKHRKVLQRMKRLQEENQDEDASTNSSNL